jgi:hypothetical protein
MAVDKIIVVAVLFVSISSVLKEERLLKKLLYFEGFEILTAVAMKSSIFWGVASCLAYSSTPKMEAKRRLTLIELHVVISQKTELFVILVIARRRRRRRRRRKKKKRQTGILVENQF